MTEQTLVTESAANGDRSVRYPEANYHAHLLEQYKLCAEMADRVSARRLLANNMYIAMMGAGAIAFCIGPEKLGTWSSVPIRLLFAVCCAMLSILWRETIIYYRDLNSAKYNVIIAIEKSLPAKAFAEEWADFKELRKIHRKRWRVNLSTMETLMPFVGFIVSIIAFIYAILYGVDINHIVDSVHRLRLIFSCSGVTK